MAIERDLPAIFLVVVVFTTLGALVLDRARIELQRAPRT